MRINHSMWIIVIAAVILSGCQGARVPLGEADESEVDRDLAGSWFSTETSDEGDYAHLQIAVFNEHEYSVDVWEDGDDDDRETLRAFTTPVGGVLFANVHCVECDDENEYFFFRFELTGDGNLVVRGLETNLYSSVLHRFESSEDLKAYVLKHVDDESFYDDELMVFSRNQ
jgi:hypothetical protein